MKTLRERRSLDQATLAARAGVGVRTLRNLEDGNCGEEMKAFQTC
ncbi:hypothetical protein [Ralstonia mojiangensis]